MTKALARESDKSESATLPLDILVVDDSRVMQDILKLVLSKRRHHVELAKDGTTALAALKAHRYDVALVDFHMPDIDGVQVVSAMKSESYRAIRLPCFIGITADVKGLLAHPQNCETFDLVITKPIDVAHLCEVLDNFPQHLGWTTPQSSELPVIAPAEPEDSKGERRLHRRVRLDQGGTLIKLHDGTVHECRVLDLSVGGAAVETSIRPTVGDRLFLGRTEGRVVRHMAIGIAIEFLRDR